jgi:hypothetical protein
MRGGGAGGEIAVAPALLAAQRADALHVAKHERLGTRQIVLVDGECRQHLRQFIGGMRPLADQRLQIGVSMMPVSGGLLIWIRRLADGMDRRRRADTVSVPPEATGAIGTSSPVMLIRSRGCSRRRQDRVQKLVSPLSLAFDRAEQIVSSLPG